MISINKPEIKQELQKDEKLLWTGSPKQGILFRWVDVFMVPFKLKPKSLKESANSGWFFENPYKPGLVMTKEQFSYRFNRVRNLAKLSKNVVFHQLRIRVTTDAFRAGIDIGAVQDFGGWKTLQMPLSYFKRAQEDYINASKKIGKFKTFYS